VIAVYRVTKEAISAARRGHGPTLVDCVNYLAPGRRGRDERDPLLTFRGYLERHNLWSDFWYSELHSKYKQEVAAARAARKNHKS
jgi:TPP-dependent pyruvate/acetoin dehydrogenase alpha subunit